MKETVTTASSNGFHSSARLDAEPDGNAEW